MLKYDDVLARSKLKSDINEHLIRLYTLTTSIPHEDKIVVELGVRRGESTTALLAAINESGGHLFSVDIGYCIKARIRLRNEPNWTFIKEDDMKLIKTWRKPIDLLLIDTCHVFKHTISELREWGNWVKTHGLIVLHDTTAPNYPDVMKSINLYLDEHPSFSFTNYPECSGLGVIELN